MLWADQLGYNNLNHRDLHLVSKLSHDLVVSVQIECEQGCVCLEFDIRLLWNVEHGISWFMYPKGQFPSMTQCSGLCKIEANNNWVI